MTKEKSRRAFFSEAAIAGGSVFAGSARVNASNRDKKKKNIASTELISVGAIALGEFSHLNYDIWTPSMNPVETEAWPVGRTTGMKITHCWDKIPEVSEAFAKKYKCTAVKNYYDMVGKVDGMIFPGFMEAKWWPKLAKPYLEAGMPCALDRPFAYSMKEAHEIVDTARKHNAPLLCYDIRENIQQTVVARAKIAEWLGEGRIVVGANGDNSSGNDYPHNGVHGLFFMLAILGLDVELAGLQADGWWGEKKSFAPVPQTWGQIILKYNGIDIPGKGKQTRPFVASQLQSGSAGDSSIRLY
jgi:hypothetical protein